MLATRSFSAARHCFTSRGASLAVQVRFPPLASHDDPILSPPGVFILLRTDSY